VPSVAATASRSAWLPAVLAAAAVVIASACSKPPVPYDVVATFGSTDHSIPLWVRDDDGEVIGNERRPTVEASRLRKLEPNGAPSANGDVLRQTYLVGPFLAGQRVLLTREYKTAGMLHFERLPSVLQKAPADRKVTIEYPIPGLNGDASAVQLYSVAYFLPPLRHSVALPPTKIPQQSVLVGGYGLDPHSAGASRAPVAFRVVARTASGDTVLFSDTLDQSDDRSYTWSSFRVDLAGLAGETIALQLRTEVQAPAGDASAVAVPVWSVPEILAPRADPQRRNVILLSLDTLRADFVGAYGQELDTTPNLDRFAKDSALFENTYTVYPSTTASHMTMLTGLFPMVHGVYAPGKRLPAERGLLATAFAARGYQTGAVTEDGMIAEGSGFSRGFRSYREYVSSKKSDNGFVAQVVDSAIAWLRRNGDQRFFLFLHTYQVHDPYTPPPQYDVFESYRLDGKEYVGGPDASTTVRARLGYAGDLLHTDAHVARLLAALDELGRRDDTVVVVTADHGEALGEHDAIGHNWYIYEPVLRVPLLIRAPGRVPEGLRIAAPASLVDLAPTILELAGLGPDLPMQGKSLVPLLDDPDDERFRDRPIFAEKGRMDGTLDVIVRQGQWKYVSDDRRADVRYDLVADPDEKVGAKDPHALAPGQAMIDAYRADNASMVARLGNKAPATVQVDDGTQQKLRTLGYVD
jgi:arylsulfatase A-like enzyme